MPVELHRWSVSLVTGGGRSEMLFEHHSRGTGTQVLESYGWPVSAEIQTEHDYLMELYQGLLAFIEARS